MRANPCAPVAPAIAELAPAAASIAEPGVEPAFHIGPDPMPPLRAGTACLPLAPVAGIGHLVHRPLSAWPGSPS